MIVSSREPRELHSFPTRRSSDLSSASVRFSVSSRAENVAATRSACSGNRRSTSSAPRAVVVTLTARRSVLRRARVTRDRKSTRLNSSHLGSSYAVFCLKKKRDHHGGDAHDERHAAAVDDTRQEVAPDLIGAEQVVRGPPCHPGRWLKPCSDVHRERIVRRDPGRAHGARDDQEHHRCRTEAPLEPPEPLPRRRGLLRAAVGELLEIDTRFSAERHQVLTRMRGSMRPTIMSTAKLTRTIMRASRTTAHWTTGKSWLRIDSTVSVATPGQANTVSVMMAPPRSWPNCNPRTVITGMQAFRKACLTTTMGSATPLARAVLMNSMFMTSITPERTRRIVMGASAAPRQKAGTRQCRQVP